MHPAHPGPKSSIQGIKGGRHEAEPRKMCIRGRRGKFLGFMLTNRGIEANPDKCQAIMKMQSPKNVKDVQRLVGRVVALSQFMLKMMEKIKPILSLLRKASRFKWDEQCEKAYVQLKTFLACPPVIQKPCQDKPILVYLSVSAETVKVVLIQEVDDEQRPVYFVCRTLQEVETRYQMIEKVTLALVTTARRMCAYFQNHEIIIRTDYPIARILSKPDLAGRVITWNCWNMPFDINQEVQ